MLDAAGDALRQELLRLFARGVEEPLSEREFDDYARRIFSWQFDRNAPYAAFCRRRGVTPDTLKSWRELPAVPTLAFKEIPLLSGDPDQVEVVFRTSGTTRGPERRGEHRLLDVSLYEAALAPMFAAFVLPDQARIPLLSLVPPPRLLPDSSLAYMIRTVMDRFGAEGSDWFADLENGLHVERLVDTLRNAQGPVALLGTSLAFVHLIDALRSSKTRLRLPKGSRIMDTGGFKSRSREVSPRGLRDDYAEWLRVMPHRCVNEYGMTELTSQFYDATLRAGGTWPPERKVAPPWMRTLAADPETLAPLPRGTRGVLRHVDLANLSSVIAVQTEDEGFETEDGCVLLGRAPGAEPRGCSIAADLLLEAAGEAG